MRRRTDQWWPVWPAFVASPPTTLSSIVTVAMTAEKRDQCIAVLRSQPVQRNKYRPSPVESSVSLFFVHLFLYSVLYQRTLTFAESKAPSHGLSINSWLHSSDQNKNSCCLGLIDVTTHHPCQEYPTKLQATSIIPQPTLESGPLQILIDLGLRNDTETELRRQSWVLPQQATFL